jgi:hypothetical protein
MVWWQFCAMDSGANIFLFIVSLCNCWKSPTLHCLTSATSGPAHVSLQSAKVLFGMRDFVGTMRMLYWTAFIHAGLPFALFPLSALGAQWCYFDFYDIIGLQCGTIFFPFDLTDGLYLAGLFAFLLFLVLFLLLISILFLLYLLLENAPILLLCLRHLCCPFELNPLHQLCQKQPTFHCLHLCFQFKSTSLDPFCLLLPISFLSLSLLN